MAEPTLADTPLGRALQEQLVGFRDLLREVLDTVGDEGELETVLERLLPEAEAIAALPPGYLPLHQVARLRGRLRDLLDLPPVTAARLRACERAFWAARDAQAHNRLFTDTERTAAHGDDHETEG